MIHLISTNTKSYKIINLYQHVILHYQTSTNVKDGKFQTCSQNRKPRKLLKRSSGKLTRIISQRRIIKTYNLQNTLSTIPIHSQIPDLSQFMLSHFRLFYFSTFPVKNHSFSMYAKFSRKLTFLIP